VTWPASACKIFCDDKTIEATRIRVVAADTIAAIADSVAFPSPGANEYPMSIPETVTLPLSPTPVPASSCAFHRSVKSRS